MSGEAIGALPAPVPVPSAPSSPSTPAESGFGALLHNLNPLQYMPVVGTIYRLVTGDQPSPEWRLGGAIATGALMGGPLGIITSVIGVGVEELFHRAIGDAEPNSSAPDPALAAWPDGAARQKAIAAYVAASTADCGVAARGGIG